MESAPRRAIARAQGKIVHYRRAIPYLGAVTPAFSPLTSCGSDNRREWDAVVPLSSEFHAAVDYCIRTIVSCGAQGRPLWLVPASSVYRAFLAGDSAGARIAVLVWDASVHGWGAVFRTEATTPGLLLIGTFSPGDSADMTDKQVHRETKGGLLAFRAAIQ